MQRSSRVDYDALADLYDTTPHREKSADPEFITFLAECGPTAGPALLDIACGTANQQIANRDLAPDAKFVGLDALSVCCARRGARCRISPGCMMMARPCRLDRVVLTSLVVSTPSTISATRRACCTRHFACCGAAVVRALQFQESEDWLYYAYFPQAKTRDFADFWTPDAMVSEMSTAGFAGTEMQLRHVYRERDLAELLSAMQFRERNSQLLSLSDAAYAAGLRCIERDLNDPQTP